MTATIEDEAVKRAENDRLRADAQAAVALVVERAAKIATRHWEGEPEDRLAMEAEIRALADADGLAAAQQWEAGLTDAVERLVVVLDRNDKKGPIPDVEMMFCWLAAQDIRAAFRAALSNNERKDDDTL